MKYIALILVLGACVEIPKTPATQTLHVGATEYQTKLVVVEVDGCEYVMFNGYKEGGGITHKGNCKNHTPCLN